MLALSWSPAYCEAEGGVADSAQCAAEAGHRFIVHGLWPQFERGWPEYCDSDEPDFVPRSIVEETFDIMPSAGLIGHQWRKHGSCSGLSHDDYFETVRSARQRIAIPQSFANVAEDVTVAPRDAASAFIDANPGMPADGIAVTCDTSRLREIRICLTPTLEFRSCEEVSARQCSLPRAELIAP